MRASYTYQFTKLALHKAERNPIYQAGLGAITCLYGLGLISVGAVPIGAADTCAALARECDELVCLQRPEPFRAVGEHYEDFGQTSDEEVETLLGEAHTDRAGS